jgi:hypothetical protein
MDRELVSHLNALSDGILASLGPAVSPWNVDACYRGVIGIAIVMFIALSEIAGPAEDNPFGYLWRMFIHALASIGTGIALVWMFFCYSDLPPAVIISFLDIACWVGVWNLFLSLITAAITAIRNSRNPNYHRDLLRRYRGELPDPPLFTECPVCHKVRLGENFCSFCGWKRGSSITESTEPPAQDVTASEEESTPPPEPSSSRPKRRVGNFWGV